MRVLMCSPIYLEVLEENPKLNPWMKKSTQPNRTTAFKQWHTLENTLLNIGLEIWFIAPQPKLGDMCFVANAAWGQNNMFLLAQYHPEVWWRKDETRYYVAWFLQNRHRVYFLPQEVYFEGQGDIVSLNKSYIFGHGQRNSIEVVDYLEKHFGLKRIVPVELVDSRFYHLDVALHFAKGVNSILWCPDAFSKDSRRRIERLMGHERIAGLELSADEALQDLGRGRINFLLNSVYAGPNEIMGWNERFSEFPSKVRHFLESKGCTIWPIDVSEFGLSGGGARCLTLFLD